MLVTFRFSILFLISYDIYDICGSWCIVLFVVVVEQQS